MSETVGGNGRCRTGADEGGFVLAWMALIMVVLLAFAGFAIDVAHWWVTAGKLQKSADAAALAGAIFMPSDLTTASNIAQEATAANGYRNGAGPVVVTVGPANRPTQLRVAVRTTVGNFFAGIVGYQTQTITRAAVAEYQGPVPMGSPSNTFGNEPVVRCRDDDFANDAAGIAAYQACLALEEDKWSTSDISPQLWMNVAGPQSSKQSGDAYQANLCVDAADFCSGSNQEYAEGGYTFRVRVTNGEDPLAIDVFDPAFINVGNRCDNANLPAAAAAIAGVADARYRYARGIASPFCTGDQSFGGAGLPRTTYLVRTPDDSPWDDLDNEPLACDPQQFSGFDGPLLPRLTPGDDQYDNDLDDGRTVHETFRQWVRICTVDNPEIGDYIVQVRGNAMQGAPRRADLASGSGHNRLSMRAAHLTSDGARGAGVSMFASQKMSMYSNADGSNSQFHMARVFPGADGRRLRIRIYDTGDAGGAGSLTVVPPPDSGLTSFVSCQYRAANATSFGAPGACSVPVNSTQQGRWHEVDVPIPTGYSCSDGNPYGCWVRIKFNYPAGTQVQDTTTWSAQIIGDPVRLIS